MSKITSWPASFRAASGGRRLRIARLIAAVAAAAPLDGGAALAAPGEVAVPPTSVPPSQYLSPEAAAALARRLPSARYSDPMDWAAVAPQLRARYDASLAPLLAKWRARYPVKVEETVIGGVPVAIVEPEAGPAPRNRNKILINLHGGAFIVGGGRGGLIESVPVAAIGGYRVVSVDYRMAPEHLYPAASEDVAAVYGALLKTFTAEDIGLYGCSSGGTLVAQSLVWFARHALPRPGAAGVLCASLDPNFGGDSVYTSALLTGLPPVAPPRPGVRWPGSGSTPYMAKADLLDAAASPLQHPEALKRFPPTLFMTATRAPEMSAAVTSHNRLRSLGVEAELYVWDGLWHGFAGDPDLPESIAFQEAIVRFFDAHLP